MLLAQDMRLAELVGELGRYRPGVLRCHPGIADLRVSGAFRCATPTPACACCRTPCPSPSPA